MRSRLSRVLLKYLQSGEMLTDAELMNLLWPNGIPSHARVDKFVRMLRKEGYAVETVHGYRLKGGNRELQTPQTAPAVARRAGVPTTYPPKGGEAAGGNYNYGSSDGG